MGSEAKIRLDQHLVNLGEYATRSRARDSIERGCVRVKGKDNSKPGSLVDPTADVAIIDPAQKYVSRAALKLIEALDHFNLDPTGCNCLDLGASTGGFTQVLLERGAKQVFAVDVGHNQLAAELAEDSRVNNFENLNAREIDPALFAEPIKFVVCDLSFISLKLALVPALNLAATGARGVFLIKPQFEVGKENIGKAGIVKDAKLIEETARDLSEWLHSQPGWRSLGIVPSPIKGADGNREFLLAGEKNA